MALTQVSTDGIKNGTISGADLTTNIDLIDNQKIRFGNSSDLSIFHDSSNSYIEDSGTGKLNILSSQAQILNPAANEAMAKFIENAGVELRFDNSVKIETRAGDTLFHDDIRIQDNNKINIGTLDDMQLFHDGFDSRIHNLTGNFLIRNEDASGNIFLRTKTSESAIDCVPDGAVNLYYDNSKKFETKSDGVDITGELQCDSLDVDGTSTFSGLTMFMTSSTVHFDNIKGTFGTSLDLEILHDGTNSFIKNKTGNLHIKPLATEEGIILKPNGAVELHHDNSVKLTTTSDGVDFGTGGADDICCISGTTIHRTGGNGCGISFATNTILPSNSSATLTDGSMGIGSSSHRFGTIFAATGTINTSDKNEKNTIIESDLGLDFINKLKPISFKWNNTNLDSKTHYGLVAQDIQEILSLEGKTNQDFAALNIPTEGSMGLNYSEFISPLIKAIQELSAKVAALEAA